VLVGIVLLTFAPLLFLGAANVDVQNFATGDWTAVPSTIPVIALAFVFHNVVPVVATSLEGDARKAKVALMAGTAIPFAMFVLWDAALLGSVSQAQAEDALDAVARSGGAIEAIADPLAALQATSPAAAALVSGFSFFAITTSFVGFVLGLVDFLSDGLGFRAEESETKTQKGNDWRPFRVDPRAALGVRAFLPRRVSRRAGQRGDVRRPDSVRVHAPRDGVEQPVRRFRKR
jgi:tyrosine-specific transport protein